MSADDWIRSLPDDARDAAYPSALLAAVDAGILRCDFVPVTNTIAGRSATFYVSADALHATLGADYERAGKRLAAGSRFRPQLGAALLQQAADKLGAMLPTALVCDLAFEQAAARFDAATEPTTTEAQRSAMSSLADSLDWNAKVEALRAGRDGLLRDVGKTWLVSNLLMSRPAGSIAVNYGFYSTRAPNMGVRGHACWQSLGTRHNAFQFDYSQTGQLMLSECVLDGVVVDTAALLEGAYGLDAARLGSHNGAISARCMRQPGA